jgi:glycosyltransferase involved in cell wall biosynthesis
VSLEPAVHPRDVPSLLASFDVLLCPSRALEGGPTVALEAMAVGTPVIGSAIPALTEIVQAGVTGWLHAPGDWRALAARLAELAESPAAIDACRERLPPSRTLDAVAKDYEALYQR